MKSGCFLQEDALVLVSKKSPLPASLTSCFCFCTGAKASKPMLRAAFSLTERDSVRVDQKHVSNMQKVVCCAHVSLHA